MKTRLCLAAAALVLAACGTADPTPRDAELMAAYRGTQAPSIYGLIGERQRLSLTSPQVTALDSIAEELRTTNHRLTDSLREITGSRSGGPVRAPRDSVQRAAFLPVLRQIGQNNQAAVRAVEAALTPDQRRIVCGIARENLDERTLQAGRRGPPGGMRRMPPGGMEPDSLMPAGYRGWPWCAPGQVRPDSLRPRTTSSYSSSQG
jgi:hypothetical protein